MRRLAIGKTNGVRGLCGAGLIERLAQCRWANRHPALVEGRGKFCSFQKLAHAPGDGRAKRLAERVLGGRAKIG